MKNIKLKFSLLLIGLFIANLSFAQSKMNRRSKMMEKRMEHLTEKLNLNEAQQTSVQTIFAANAKKRQAIFQKEGERTEKYAAMKALEEQEAQAIEKVLTKDQTVQFKELRAAQIQKMEKRRGKMAEQREKMAKVDKKALKKELKAYKEKNIIPILKKQRAKLETSISEVDKKEINELRTSFKGMKKKWKRKEMKKAKKKGTAPSDEQKSAMKKMKAAKKAAMKKAKELAQKYETEIKGLREEIAPQIEKWKTDIQAIYKKHGLEKSAMKKGDHKKAKGKKKHKRKQGKKGKKHHGKNMEHLSPVRFLLLDPNAESRKEAREVMDKNTTLRIYPNPSQEFNNIEYKVSTAGNVSIELHDQDGKLVKTVLNEYKEAGTYKVRVNLGDLKGYVYMYVLKDQTGVTTEKFVLRK